MPDPQAQQAPAAAPPPEIDLSAGLEPKAAPIDLSAGLEPKPVNAFPGSAPSGNMYPGAPVEATAHKDISGPGAMNTIGRGLESFAGHDIPNPFAFAHEAVSNPGGVVAGIASSTPPGQAFEGIKNSVAGYEAYEKARASGMGVLDSLQAASETLKNRDATAQMVQQRAEEFKKDPGAASVRALADVAAMAASHYMGKGMGPAAGVAGESTETAAPAAGTAKPNIIQKAVQGKNVAQAPAQSAIKAAVGADEDASLISGNKTAVDDKIADLYKQERAAYQTQDTTAGTDVKALRAKLKNTEYQINQLTDTEEDVAKEAKLEKSRTSLQDKIDEAENKLKAKGIDPKAADNIYRQRKSAEDFKDALVQQTSSDGKSVNIDGLLKASKKLRFDEMGDRLESFMGKQGATDFMSKLEAAQKLGVHAMKVQQVMRWLAGIGGVGVAEEAVRHALP